MDTCQHCSQRGDMAGCIATPCNTHDSWFAQQLAARSNLNAASEDASPFEVREKNSYDPAPSSGLAEGKLPYPTRFGATIPVACVPK